MADSVYYHLERMLPELDDLKQRGLFSVSEVKEIARRRREFEFRLERRSKVKEDYLNYIQYELQLEKLRKIRKKAIVRELEASKRRWHPSLCDRASAMHVMLIFQRATTRFKGDLDLWMQYLQYCRSKGTRRMQKVLTKALRLHPTVPGLWIYAAAWEFGHNADIGAARALMQRGLRMCPHSEKLWLEYFRMELVYTERLRTKILNSTGDSKVLQVENGDGDGDGDGDNGDIMLLDDSKEDKSRKIKPTLTPEEVAMKISKVDELGYKLASTIYKNAISALPSNCTFRQQFIYILERSGFAQASNIKEEILDSLEKDFPNDAGCWDWKARNLFHATGDKDEAIKIYEKAVEVSSSVDIFEQYTQFLKEISGLECSKSDDSCKALEVKEDRSHAAKELLELYNRAKANGVTSPCLAEGHVTALLKLGKLELAKQLLEEFCLGDFRTCSRLWSTWVMLEMKQGESENMNRILDICEQCLKQIPINEAHGVWIMVMEYFGGQLTMYNRILDMIVYQVAGTIENEVCTKVACSLVDWILYSQDIKHARQFYSRILGLPGCNVEFQKHCIQIECQMAAVGCKEAIKSIKKLFESAVERFSQSTEMWLEYCAQEIKAGNLDEAGRVYWRAKKTLDDPSKFIEGHHLLSKEVHS